MTRRSKLLPLAAVALTAGVAVPITTGSAQAPATTITLTYGKAGASSTSDLAPKATRRTPLSLGDRMTGTQTVLIDGKVAGTLHTDAVITSPKPTSYPRFTAILQSVAHLKDGDLYATGFVDSATTGDRSVIVGGTGKYAGATGTVVGSENGAVITLGS